MAEAGELWGKYIISWKSAGREGVIFLDVIQVSLLK